MRLIAKTLHHFRVYTCMDCGRKRHLTYSDIERASKPSCPRCGSTKLESSDESRRARSYEKAMQRIRRHLKIS